MHLRQVPERWVEGLGRGEDERRSRGRLVHDVP
jgi:hypothetical protein